MIKEGGIEKPVKKTEGKESKEKVGSSIPLFRELEARVNTITPDTYFRNEDKLRTSERGKKLGVATEEMKRLYTLFIKLHDEGKNLQDEIHNPPKNMEGGSAAHKAYLLQKDMTVRTNTEQIKAVEAALAYEILRVFNKSAAEIDIDQNWTVRAVNASQPR